MVKEKVKIALIVLAYFVISISMVLMNKYLLSGKSSVPAPFFVTWYQCVVTAIICWVLGRLGKYSRRDSLFHQFPVQTYEWKKALRIMPLSLIFVSMITFNNLCLTYVKVSFYLVARSLTIVFNVILSYVLLGIRTSYNVILCCLVVIYGFYTGSEGEIDFSISGTIFGVLSSLFVSLNSIYTKKMMPIMENNSWKLCFYNNMNSAILFLPLIFGFEREVLKDNVSIFLSSSFWLVMNMAGVFGFLIGIVTIAQISVTSPLTHNISGTAKACVQTLIAVFFLHDRMSLRSMVGTILVLGGTFLYSIVRSREMDREKKKESPKLIAASTDQREEIVKNNESMIV